MAISTPKTFASGDPLTASDMNTYVSDNLSALLNPPSCKVYRAANQSIANNTLTAILFTHELWDTASMHSTSSNTERVTVPIGGLYLVTWYTRYGPGTLSANHYAATQLRVNNSVVDETLWVLYNGMSTAYAEGTGTSTLKLNANDYVTLVAYQNTGNAMNLDVGAVPSLAVTWIGLG